jgi:hypothetical protein
LTRPIRAALGATNESGAVLGACPKTDNNVLCRLSATCHQVQSPLHPPPPIWTQRASPAGPATPAPRVAGENGDDGGGAQYANSPGGVTSVPSNSSNTQGSGLTACDIARDAARGPTVAVMRAPVGTTAILARRPPANMYPMFGGSHYRGAGHAGG